MHMLIFEFQLLPSLEEEFLYKRYFDDVQVAATSEETKKTSRKFILMRRFSYKFLGMSVALCKTTTIFTAINNIRKSFRPFLFTTLVVRKYSLRVSTVSV
jgi:hypothetical protein